MWTTFLDRNPFGKLLDRIAVIVSKNFKLSFRNLIAVALQILVPLLFTFFIFAAKLSYTHNSIFKIYVSPDTDPKSHSMQNIPRCIPFRTSHCYTMAYVPSIGIGHNVTSGQTKTLNVSYWIEQLAVENNIPASEIISFANSSDLNEFLYENQNTTQAAFIFEQENLDDIASGNISFIVQYNQTKQCDFPSSSFCYYQEEYLIPNMIRAMNEYLMKNLTGKNVQLNFSRSIFPHPAISGELNAFREYGPFLLFGVYMLNFVFFLGELVNEKELKLRESMKMAGLGQAMYMSTWFVTFFVSMLLTSFLLIAFGAAFQFELYLSTAFGNYFLTFWIFSMALICWAFLFSTFTPKSSQVNYVGFVFFIVGYLIASSSPYVYGTESSGKPYLKSDLFFLRYLFALIPSTMFYKGVYDMATYAISGHGLTWSERSSYTNTFPLTTCWVWMIWTSIVVMVLAVYLDNILPNEFGSRLPWYYPFSKYYWFGGRIAAKRRQHQMQSNLELNSSFAPVEESSAEILSESSKEHMQRGNFSLGPEITVEESQSLGQSSHDRVAEGEDEDVILEERSIKSGRIRNTAVVVINQLYKEFRTGFRKKFVAVNGLSLAIDEGHLFCLLGHNGAGKSTTFNILTGVLKATCGDALIYSHSVAHEQSEIRRIMGVCPQHDILWKRLTGAEHVNLFATLKDIPHSKRKAEVEYRLNQVGLFEVGTKFASQYSGGMQRRLSVAIALTGDPKIVFLDEPTTGMDPVSRRHAWEMIEAAKAGRVIVLTTHSMEEADVLGDRIGIMSKGRLRCLGTPLHLKNKFGTGYRLVILCKEENVVRKFVTRNIPETEETEMTKTPSNLIVLTFVLPRGISQKLAEFFSSLERQKDALEISDYSISMSSLEEVFLKVASQENVDAIQNTDSQNSLWNRIRRWFRKPLP
ncbi:ABC transporter A family member 2 [Galdieria sulphuraria]|nr:ABC transporter A family member 2 [Galdieria sulphuraria]